MCLCTKNNRCSDITSLNLGVNCSFTNSANITISSNTAQLGGGVYSDNNTFNIDGPSVFERNVATYYGGGIYTRRTPLILTGNNMFNANSAWKEGGYML